MSERPIFKPYNVPELIASSKERKEMMADHLEALSLVPKLMSGELLTEEEQLIFDKGEKAGAKISAMI